MVRAIKISEEELKGDDDIYCLGDIVHNPIEVERLENKGLKTIGYEDLKLLSDSTVIIRSHGEPPETYTLANHSNNKIIDATCKIVHNLQHIVKSAWKEIKFNDGQIVIYGSENHPEVIGLNGQCENTAIIVEEIEHLNRINFSLPIRLFAQTTKDPERYRNIIENIYLLKQHDDIVVNQTICKWMIRRVEHLREFARSNDLIIFVSGRKSSNGQFLYEISRKENNTTYFVSSEDEIEQSWFEDVENVGITGATSTPAWLLKGIADKIESFN